MRLLLLISCLALAACGGKPAPAAPTPPAPPPVEETPEPEITLSADVINDLASETFAGSIADGQLTLTWAPGVEPEILDELSIFGVTTKSQLAAFIPADYEERGIGSSVEPTNVVAMMRDLMIIHDARKYFAEAWKNRWSAWAPEEMSALSAYGVDFSILEQAGVFDYAEGYEGYEDYGYDEYDVEGGLTGGEEADDGKGPGTRLGN